MQDNLQEGQTSGASQENANQSSSQSSIPADIKAQMDMSLYGQLNDSERQELQQQLQQPAAGEEGAAGATSGEGQAQGAAETTPPAAGAFDEIAYIKANFGFDSIEAAKQALEAAKKPVAAEAPTFANEQSKKIYEAILSGNLKPVKEFLDVQFATENMDTLSPEQQIKMHIKHQYPTLSQQMIDRQYSKMYGVKEESEYEDPIDYQIDKEMAQQKIINDAATARNFFNDYRSKIELPQFQPAQAAVDENYEAWKASNAQADELYNTVTVPTIKAISANDLVSKFTISDANNQMNFEVSHAVDAADLAAAQNDALNYGEYMKQFYTPDGKLNGARLMQAILRDKYFDKYVQTTARQAVMAERKRLIGKETPPPHLQRQDAGSGEESEFDRMMRLSMAVR